MVSRDDMLLVPGPGIVADEVGKLGSAVDFGICKGLTDGEARCRLAVNTAKSRYCLHHIQAKFLQAGKGRQQLINSTGSSRKNVFSSGSQLKNISVGVYSQASSAKPKQHCCFSLGDTLHVPRGDGDGSQHAQTALRQGRAAALWHVLPLRRVRARRQEPLVSPSGISYRPSDLLDTHHLPKDKVAQHKQQLHHASLSLGMRALALLVAVAPLLIGAASGAGECSSAANKALYDDALARIASCSSSVGFALEAPLTATRTQAICASCTALAAATKTKSFGDCTVEGASAGKTTTLQAKLETLFACTAVVAPSSSSSGSSDIETPTPTTTAPTPSKTNATTSGSGSSQAPSPTKKTPAPTSADESASGSTSGSISGTGSKKTGDAGTDSGSAGGQVINIISNDGSSIGLVVGIAAGVVVLVILIATFIVCRQRRSSRRSSREEPLILSENTPETSGGAVGSSKQAHSGGNNGSTSSSAPRSSLQYLDGTFLLPSQSGGLWEDEAIVAVRIPREKVISEVLLSRGGYGEVYRGVYNGHSVAIKTLLPEKRKSMKQINAFLAEVKLMAALEHDQIVRFVGVAWDSLTDLCVVSEYMEGGDLRAALTRFEEKERRPHGFDHDKVKIALHIAHALTYLHSLQPIVLHRDLKSKNILLDKALNAKLTDFGVSRERSDRTMTAGVGSSLWMAPEVMLGERYDEKSDIFSFGVVLSELDSHVLPYSHVTESSSGRRIPDTAILQMVSLGRLRVKFSPEALPSMVDIANACVMLDPQDRPSAADMMYQLHNVLKSL